MMLSPYEFKARLTPGMLAVLPVVIAIAALGIRTSLVMTAATALLTFAGGTFLLAVIVGNVGRGIQDDLWDSWGGPPTTRLLRLRETSANAQRRDSWRAAVEKYSDVALLDASAEAGDPAAADDAIETALGRCRHLGHGGEAGKTLVQAENAQYGLERNLLGFRWIGRAITVGSLVLLCCVLVVGGSTIPVQIGILADLGVFLTWLFLPSEERTKAAASRYAHQLLEAVAVEAREH